MTCPRLTFWKNALHHHLLNHANSRLRSSGPDASITETEACSCAPGALGDGADNPFDRTGFGRASALRSELSSLGYETFHASDRLEALNLHAAHRFDAILADLDVWRAGAEEPSNIFGDCADASPVIILTELAEIARAAQALKAGASFYLVRPFSRDQLEVALERTLAGPTLHTENTVSDRHARLSALFPSLIASSREMRQTLNLALKAARSEANVLLIGESGTGKELVAHAIHAQSARAKHPFVPVDCASLPENLLQAELFGYEKSAFTGAARAKPGLMEAANSPWCKWLRLRSCRWW